MMRKPRWEPSTWILYRNPVIEKIEADYQETLKKCIPVTLETCYSYSWLGRKAGRLLRLIAPLM